MGQINTAALVQDRPLLDGNDAVTVRINNIKVRFPKVSVPLSEKKKQKKKKNNPKYN